jgi:membrane protease YdiL (CAAX protease family)
MPTSISEGWRQNDSRRQTLVVTLVGALSVSIDYYLAAYPSHFVPLSRAANAGIALAAYVAMAKSPYGDLGLRVTAENGARYWLKLGLILGASLSIIAVIGIAMLRFGYLWQVAERIPAVPPDAILERFRVMCMEAPLLEEFLYRLIVCVPLAIRSERIAIVGSGLLFAGLHFVYGNPSPENFVAGYFLAWCYLKSGTILVPIAFHAGGNAIALGFQSAAWYVLYG